MVSLFNVPVKSTSSPTPQATPRAFDFWKIFVQIPLTGPKSSSKAPIPRKITRLLFQHFSSFYYASETVHVNMMVY